VQLAVLLQMVCKEMNDQPNCKENAFEKLRQVLKPYNSFRVTAKTFDVKLGDSKPACSEKLLRHRLNKSHLHI